MRAVTETTPFEALDECHRQIMAHLEDLTELARRIEANGVDAAAQQQAGAIEAFSPGTSREHHAQEEKTVFPPLLATGDPAAHGGRAHPAAGSRLDRGKLDRARAPAERDCLRQ